MERSSSRNGPDRAPIAISAQGLRKRYRLGELHSLRQTIGRLTRRDHMVESRSFEALAGVNLDVYRGDALGIVGSNGSGKSTMLQILAGTTLPTGGLMEIHGRVIPLLAVATGFHGELTGRENVRLFAASLRVPLEATEARMDALTAFAELENHMDTPIKRYSSGMLARLSFAIAMQFPGDIYVFDEVLAVVDGEFEARCLAEIRRLYSEGRTVVFVSHKLDQVAEVCNRVLWLEHGKVRQAGPSNDVLAAYAQEQADHLMQ